MDTTTQPIPNEEAMAIQMTAARGLADAETEVRIARLWAGTATWEESLHAGLRLTRALRALGAARAADDPARDLPCPDAEA